MTEISPALEEALTELANLLDSKVSINDKKAELIADLEEFECYV